MQITEHDELKLAAIQRNSKRGFLPSTEERDFLLTLIAQLLAPGENAPQCPRTHSNSPDDPNLIPNPGDAL